VVSVRPETPSCKSLTRPLQGYFDEIYERISRKILKPSSSHFTRNRLNRRHCRLGFKWCGRLFLSCKTYDGDVASPTTVAHGSGSLRVDEPLLGVLMTPDCSRPVGRAAHCTVTRHSSRTSEGQETSTNLHRLDLRMDARPVRIAPKLDSKRGAGEVFHDARKSLRRHKTWSPLHDQGDVHFWSAPTSACLSTTGFLDKGRGESHQGEGMRRCDPLREHFSRLCAIGFIHERVPPPRQTATTPSRHQATPSAHLLQAQGAQVYECKAAPTAKLWPCYSAIRSRRYCSTAIRSAGITCRPTWEHSTAAPWRKTGRQNAPCANGKGYPLGPLKLEVTSHRASASVSGSHGCQRINTQGRKTRRRMRGRAFRARRIRRDYLFCAKGVRCSRLPVRHSGPRFALPG